MMKSFLSETTKPRALTDIFYVASPGELLPMKLIQIMLREPKMAPAAMVKEVYIKPFFSEYCHVAYQIKGNEAYINILVCINPRR